MPHTVKQGSAASSDYDLVIAGGGLAGLSLAHALASVQPWRIAIIESKAESVCDNSLGQHFDERVLALSAMTVRILKTLGLWCELEQQGHTIERIHVSDAGNYGKVRLDAKQQGFCGDGEPEFGQVMAAQKIANVLQQQAKKLELDWYRPDQIVATELAAESRVIRLSSGASLRTKLLIVADGSDSNTSKLLGVQAEIHDYQHVAVIANISTDQAHDGLAVERFTAQGPLALLPMTENRRSLVWTLPPEQAETVMALDDDDFSKQLQQAMGYRHGLISQVGTRQSYPLKRRLVTQAALPRAVIIGNAAHALHPIAGQGFNLALRDVMELAMQLNQLGPQSDIGAVAVVQDYQQQRQSDQLGVANATHALALLFSNNIGVLKWARNIGLVAMSHLPAAQQWLVNQAMGVTALSQIVEEWPNAKR